MSTFLQSFDLPRQISLSMKISLIAGNVFFFVGTVFFVVGMGFIIGFSFFIDFKSVGFGGDLKKTNAEILRIEGTNSRMNDVEILSFEYRYVVNDKAYINRSYQAGSGNLKPGDSVLIEYENSKPERSRIEGMNMSEFPLWTLSFLLIFPLIGLVFLFIAIRRGIRHINLVKHGILAKGKVVRKERTNTRINNQYVYKVFFEFKAQDGHVVTSNVNTNRPYLLEDEPEELLVYDSNNPENAVLLDALDKSVKNFFTEDRH